MAAQRTTSYTSDHDIQSSPFETPNYLDQSASHLSLPNFAESGKRRLLLIYVHGFNGSEASFLGFPAHIHSLLTDVLAESHEVYTRIYPRYKSRGDMKVARDQFSSWLEPHEASDLDIILLGHSLGGILTAEVALLPSSSSHSHQTQKHRILGMVNFDVPFLGLHPGIIQTAFRSLFHQDPGQLAEHDTNTNTNTAEASDAFSPSHFDPPFFNDVHLAERPGLQGVMHFLHKNYNRITRSTVNRIMSPYAFAGCLNNYPELRRRYKQLMELEAAHGQPCRVRFVNYYTASECPPPPPKETSSSADARGDTLREQQENETDPCPLELTKSQEETELHHESSADDHSPAPDMGDSIPKQHGKKRRKFILLPSHHWRHGDDSLWVPVNMENMNEITAHQSIFLPHGRNYDQLVGDTMATIEQWIQLDLTERLLAQDKEESK